MKKFASALFLVAGMAVMALPASADTYNVSFTGVGGQSTAGVYVYPYNFTVTDITNPMPSANISMMCIDFTRDIFIPETWQATLVNITTLPPQVDSPSFSAQQLETLAVLDSEIVHATTAQAISDLQFAAWEITAGSNPASGQFGAGFTHGADVDYSAALAAVTGGTSTSAVNSLGQTVTYSDYSYFDPTPNSQPQGDGSPQRFITYTGAGTPVPHVAATPEPSSLMLLGTGILGLASVARRRLLKA